MDNEIETSEQTQVTTGRNSGRSPLISAAMTLAFLVLAVIFFPPPITDALAYFVFCVGFLLYGAFAVVGAIGAEQNLARIAASAKLIEVDKRLEGLWQVYSDGFSKIGRKTRQTSTSADAFFNTETILAESSRPWFPLLAILKSVPGTFTGLGILGTFVGFAIGLSHFNTDSAATIQASIKVLISGINIGFNYSIIGITMSIVFNLVFLQPFIRRMDHLSQSLCDELDSMFHISEAEFTIQNLTVVVEDEEIAPGEALRMVLDNLSKQSASMGKFSSDVADSLGSIVRTSMEPIFERLSAAMDELVQQRKKEVESTSGQLLEAVRKMMTELGEKITGGTQAHLEGLIETLVAAGTSMRDVPGIIEKLQRSGEESSLAVATMYQEIPKTLEGLQSRMESFFAESMKQQEFALGLVQASLKEIENGFVTLKGTIVKTGDSMSTFDPTIERLRSVALQVTEITNNLAETQSGHLQSIETLQDAVGSQLSALSTESEALQQLAIVLSENSNSAKETALGFKGLDTEISGTFGAIHTQVQQYNQLVEKGLSKVLQDFSNHAGEFGQRMTGAISEIRELVEELNESIRELRNK